MTQSRASLIDLNQTPWYHLVNRCVRRAFLCGNDPYSGINYEHRRHWVVYRIKELAGLFAIDIGAYAVMSNHYHLIVRVDREEATAWSQDEVLKRWLALFRAPELVHRHLAHDSLSLAEQAEIAGLIELWRDRLVNISWYMRCLNESIARRANSEDDCKGRFWEGRFKSQALLDEAALASCMAYVDLNPIRARQARTPQESDFTSAQARLESWANLRSSDDTPTPQQLDNSISGLIGFAGNSGIHRQIPFGFKDYLELLDWAGQVICEDKKGYIPANTPKIVDQLSLNAPVMLDYLQRRRKPFAHAIGASKRLRAYAHITGKVFLKGLCYADRMIQATS